MSETKKYSTGALLLMARSISLGAIANELGVTRAYVGLQLQGRSILQQSTLDTILALSDGDYQLVAEVERFAGESRTELKSQQAVS